MSETPVLNIQGLGKSFDGKVILSDINFNLNEFETVALIGHSGCGKTTLLRIVCGFERYDCGLVLLNGARHEAPSKEALMLFQSFDQIQPWRTVLGNVMYPLLATGMMKKKEAQKLALKRIMDVDLQGFEKNYPHTLSGGMKQRAAVARALALSPKVLLMDEPFASLDNITRGQLQSLTMRISKKYGISILLVTHSVEEAVVMADRIIVMDRSPGRIKAIVQNSERDTSATPESCTRLVDEILVLLGDGK